MLNFCFTYCLPRQHQLVDGLLENSDNEGIEDDVVLALDEEDMLHATQTHIKGSRSKKKGSHELEESEEDEVVTTKLHEMTKHMFKLSGSIWLRAARNPVDQTCQARESLNPEPAIDHALAKKSAQASSNKHSSQTRKVMGMLGAPVGEPSVQEVRPRLTAAQLREWLHSDHVQQGTNAQQHQFLALVVERLLTEHRLIPPNERALGSDEPLLHLLHGPPGTGKSHCLVFLRELFDSVLGFRQGIDYEVVSYQSVNAVALGGTTIHSACGFNADEYQAKEAAAVAATTAKRISFWRWLFIDEISMVGARLFARMDHRIRAVKHDADQFKLDKNGQTRHWAAVRYK